MIHGEDLKSFTIFNGLQPDQLDAVAGLCGEWECGKGQYVFKVGDESENLYILRYGEVEVLGLEGIITNQRLAVMGEGEIFGELAFVDGIPRTASVRCMEPSLLLSITRTDFRKLGRTNPDIQLVMYRNIAKILAGRLRAADAALREHVFRKKSIASRLISSI